MSIQQKSIVLNIPVNYFCNQKCFFCSEWDKTVFKHLKGNEDSVVYKLLEEWVWHFHQVMFTSWEPTLNKNLWNYIRKAKELWYKNIWLITNGTQFYKDDLRKDILESWLREVTISIHGSNAKIHEDNIWVKWLYKNVIIGLIKLRKESRSLKINISMVLNRYNLGDLFNSAYKYHKLWIDILLVNTMRPDWYWKEKMKDLSIKYSDFVNYINSLPEEKIRFLNVLIEKNKLNIMDIPICFLEQTKLKTKWYWKVEVRIVEWMKAVNTVDGKVYLEKCNKCTYMWNCEWVYRDYIKSFWVEEFKIN